MTERALGQDLDHGAALDLEFDAVGHFHTQVVVAQVGHAAQHAAGDHHLVTLGDGLDHGLVLFLLLHLRADHDEVQHHEHQHQRQQAEQGGLGAASGGGGGGLGEGGGDEHGCDPGQRPRNAGQLISLRGAPGSPALHGPGESCRGPAVGSAQGRLDGAWQ